MAKLYAVKDVPSGETFQGIPIVWDEPMTAAQIAERANLPISTIRKRLNNQGLRSWAELSRSAAEGRRLQVEKMRRLMSVERLCREEERGRAAAHTRMISRGHRTI